MDILTHRTVAEISLVGMGLDVLGGLYLAYDLLAGKDGPLRSVTRISGYVVLFFIGYSAVLGVRYSAIASIGMGALLAAEYRLVDTNAGEPRSSKRSSMLFGLLRGLVLGAAATTFGGLKFGAVFGLLSGIFLSITYLFGFTPTVDYESSAQPKMTSHKAIASALRASAVAAAGLLSAVIALKGSHSLLLGLRLGIAAGAVSALVGIFSPTIEWWIENAQDRRLGLAGLALIFVGMLLQSAQYWIVVLQVPVR